MYLLLSKEILLLRNTVEESPLSKSAGEETESTDLYGINVYYDKERDGNINDVYGYGLFDNIADMNISLLTGYKYKFVCSLVKDGKNEVAYNNYRFILPIMIPLKVAQGTACHSATHISLIQRTVLTIVIRPTTVFLSPLHK